MNVFLVVAASFIISAAGFLYASVMPVQAQQLGAPSWVVTAIPMGLPSLVSLLLLLPIGILADNTGRRKELLLIATALTFIADIGLALSHSWIPLVLWRLLSGFPFAFMSLFAVILAFMLPEERRGMAMALGMGSAMLGMGLFQAISGYLLNVLGGYSGLYYFAAALAGLGFFLLLPLKAPVVKNPTTISAEDFKGVLSNRNILVTGIALCVYLTGWQMLYGSLPIVLTNVIETPVHLQTMFFAVATVMLGLGTFIWGPVIDRIGAKAVLLIGITMSAVATLLMALFGKTMWPYVILFWIATLGGVCGSPSSSTIATKSVRLELATLAVNTIFMAITLAGIVGGFAAGPILAATGLVGMLIVAAVLQFVGDLLLLSLPRI